MKNRPQSAKAELSSILDLLPLLLGRRGQGRGGRFLSPTSAIAARFWSAAPLCRFRAREPRPALRLRPSAFLTRLALSLPLLLSAPLPTNAGPALWLRDEWVDAATGHRVVRLSRVPGHSESLYFHQNAFTAAGDKLVFVNTDTEASNRLFLLDWPTRKCEPITEPGVFGPVVSRHSRKVYYQRQAALYVTDLDTRDTRLIAQPPFRAAASTVNADETSLAGTLTEPGGPHIDRSGPKSQWFDKVFDAKRPQWLYTIDIATGKTNAFYRYEGWLNHLQFSPSDPGLLMFCHEGPWHKLDRIWLIRTNGSGLRLMHERSQPMEIAGHEFWSPDGSKIWFDLQVPRGQKFFLASVDVAVGKETRYPIERDQWSVHYNISHDGKLFAGDGGASNMVAHATNGKWLWLFTPKSDGTLNPERLVNMEKHDYDLEPNVNFTPDGKWIVFRGNFDGTPQVYAVEVAKAAANAK